MVLVYLSYSKLVYDVTSGHMTLGFVIFSRETTNWQEENLQVWKRNIKKNLVTPKHLCGYRYA